MKNVSMSPSPSSELDVKFASDSAFKAASIELADLSDPELDAEESRHIVKWEEFAGGEENADEDEDAVVEDGEEGFKVLAFRTRRLRLAVRRRDAMHFLLSSAALAVYMSAVSKDRRRPSDTSTS
jgi:hypothetical protein